MESTNFFEFVRNLRNIQCPEVTVCDIIKAELDKLFSERWKKEHPANGSIQEARYWIPRPPRWITARRDKEKAQKFETEKHSLLKALLAVEGSRCSCERADTIFPRVTILSAEKQTLVDSILEHYKSAESDLEEEALLSDMNADLSNRWISLIEEKRRALLNVLSPDELNKLELSLSPVSGYLREHLFGFQPSEKEFQAIYDFQKSLGQLRLGFGNAPESLQGAVRADRKILDAGLRDALGEERFADYQLLSNPQYSVLSDVGRSLQWDAETMRLANRLFQRYAELDKEAARSGTYPKLYIQRDQELRSILGETRYAELIKGRKEWGASSPPKFQFW